MVEKYNIRTPLEQNIDFCRGEQKNHIREMDYETVTNPIGRPTNGVSWRQEEIYQHMYDLTDQGLSIVVVCLIVTHGDQYVMYM